MSGGMNNCLRQVFDWEVHGNGPLKGEWAGWRIAGREIVSPDGDRLPLRRLAYLMLRETTEKRVIQGARGTPSNVVPITARKGSEHNRPIRKSV